MSMHKIEAIDYPLWVRVIAVMLAGSGMALIFDSGNWLGGAGCLVLFLLAISRSSWTSTFGLALLFSMIWRLIDGSWLIRLMQEYLHASLIVSLVTIALLALALSLPFSLLVAALRLSSSETKFVVLFPFAVYLSDWINGHLIFGGIPYQLMGELLINTQATQWASVIGEIGIGVLIPLLAAAGRLFLASRPLLALALIVVFVAPFLFHPDSRPLDARWHKVALVQPHIPYMKWDSEVNTKARVLGQMTSEVPQNVRLVIWPETALPFDLLEQPLWRRWIEALSNHGGRHILFSGYKNAKEGKQVYVAAFITSSNGEIAWTAKHKLIPGFERPFPVPILDSHFHRDYNLTPYKDSGVLKTPLGTAGVLLCYEGLFPEESRRRVLAGAEFLVNMANNARWQGKHLAVWRVVNAARFRAIEFRRWVLIDATEGITGIVSPDGTMVESLPWFRRDFLVADIQARHDLTPYARWGDTPFLVGSIAILIVVLGYGLLNQLSVDCRARNRVSPE